MSNLPSSVEEHVLWLVVIQVMCFVYLQLLHLQLHHQVQVALLLQQLAVLQSHSLFPEWQKTKLQNPVSQSGKRDLGQDHAIEPHAIDYYNISSHSDMMVHEMIEHNCICASFWSVHWKPCSFGIKNNNNPMKKANCCFVVVVNKQERIKHHVMNFEKAHNRNQMKKGSGNRLSFSCNMIEQIKTRQRIVRI